MMRRTAKSVAALIGIAFFELTLSGCGRSGGASANNPGTGPPSPFATSANGKVDIEGGVIEIAARRFGVIRMSWCTRVMWYARVRYWRARKIKIQYWQSGARAPP